MASWEFLLQKEGDNSWLPLESPDVEILEGRYRMVSRSGYTNTSIAVRIIYQDLEQVPPVQQAQNRTLTTNSDGLMVLMPFTSLKPGLWQFSCSPQLNSGLLTTVGRKTIQLRVLPQEAELEPSFAEPEEQIVEATVTESPTPVEPPTEEQTEELSAKVLQFPTSRLSSVSERLEPPASSSSSEPPQLTISLVPPPSPTPEPSPEPENNFEILLKSLQLSLEQESFIAKLGQALILSGRVELPTPASEDQPSYSLIPAPQLQIRLSNPQTGDLLFEVNHTLPPSSLPLLFSGVVYIPFECKTRLILGEVVFCNDQVPVTTQSFNIATQVEHLLDAIDTTFGTEADQEDFPELSSLELTSLDLPEVVDPSSQPKLSPETAAILPPKIQSTSPAARPSAGLDLPSFDEKGKPTSASASPPIPTRPSAEVEKLPTPINLGEEPVAENVFPANLKSDPPPKPQKAPEVQQAFQALELNNRFWSRLNALAQDQEWSQWVKRANTTPLPDSSFNAGNPLVRPLDQGTSNSQGNSLSQPIPLPLESEEFVVDDEPLESPATFFPKRKPAKAVPPEPSSTHSTIPYILPEEQPIPEPQLEVLGTEIVAGRPVKVRVRIPDNLPRIYIKIWVYDRQSRSVVDSPRWLTEFSPNAFEQVETTVDLEIPYSSLEVQFEAIAVEMQTQRESNKVTLERSVNPPPSPSLPL